MEGDWLMATLYLSVKWFMDEIILLRGEASLEVTTRI